MLLFTIVLPSESDVLIPLAAQQLRQHHKQQQQSELQPQHHQHK